MSERRPLGFLARELDALEEKGRRRRRGVARPENALVLCSNDYLGYAHGGRGERVAIDAAFGAGASRLISGTHPPHEALEREVAAWTGHEDALVFTSGYAANVGLVSALAGPEDLVVSDALNHASIIDGIRLSRARCAVVPHRDVAAIARALREPARRRFVVVESYFSMDGDTSDLAALRSVCDEAGAALLVDEAHALGVFGEEGAGLAREARVSVDALVGTFGKALGGQGAFVAGSRELVDWLWNRARSFVFSTAMAPAVAAHDLASVRHARRDDEGRARIRSRGSRLRAGLRELGYRIPESVGPIVPVLVGEERDAVALSTKLAERGVLVTPIRPPTVPPGTSRLRVTVHAGLLDHEIEHALAAFAEARR